MQVLHSDLKGEISIAGVVTGSDKQVNLPALQATIERLGLTYTQVRDRDSKIAALFQVQGTPDVVILDRNRKVVYRGHHLPTSLTPYL